MLCHDRLGEVWALSLVETTQDAGVSRGVVLGDVFDNKINLLKKSVYNYTSAI